MTPVTIADAARHFGISPSGVHKRIARGQLRVRRVHGQVRVLLDPASTPRTAEDTEDGPRDGHEDSAEQVVEPTTCSPHVAALEAEVVWLRGQVEQHQQAEAELRRLLGMALQRLELPAPKYETVAHWPWWSWRRWLVWGR